MGARERWEFAKKLSLVSTTFVSLLGGYIVGELTGSAGAGILGGLCFAVILGAGCMAVMNFLKSQADKVILYLRSTQGQPERRES